MALLQKQRAGRSHLFWHMVFFSLILVAVYVVLKGLGKVLTPVAAALVLSYLLDPVVSWAERRMRWPRWLSTLALFVLALLVFSTLIVLVVPMLVREVQELAGSVEGYMTTIRENLIPWIERNLDIKVSSLRGLITQFGTEIKQVASTAVAPLGGVAGTVARRTAGLFSALGTLLLVPVFTFYFLPKFPEIVDAGESLIPRRYLGLVRTTAGEIDRVLAAWFRGQLTVIAVLAVLYSVGLSLVGVKMAVLIGTMTGLLAFIPYVGVAVGLGLSLALCLLEYSGPGQLVGVTLVFAVVQGIEGLVLTPKIVGEKVGLGPVGVLLALMLGGAIFGFVGILLAVPAAAALVVVLKRILSAYKDSLYYQRGAAREADPSPSTAE